jgi:hypothetical protein
MAEKLAPVTKTRDHTKSDSIIKKCGCSPADKRAWEYQDSKYGVGFRVMNPNKNGFSCTVCQKQHTA